MKVIWKFPLIIRNKQTLSLPAGSEILTIQTQRNAPCMWVLLDPTQSFMEERVFITHTTGMVGVESNEKYIGTYQVDDGYYVGHVFEQL